MKFTKKCDSTQHKISISNRRCSSAGMFYTSSAGAVTSLICFGNQKMLSRTRVARSRLHGARALILGSSLRNVLYSIFLITLPVLFVHQAHATASTLTISVTDSVSLDMASSINTGNFAHSDTSTNNVSIITNNGTGYTLGIKAKTNNSNALINSDDTSKTIPSITTSISEATYASSSSYNNTWGFRPSKLNSAVNENYIQAPTSASTLTTLDQTSSANPSTANNYNLAIGARINSSTTPGSYSNVFVITVTANPIPYTITYNKNTTDTVTNMPANTSSQTYDETVNISNQVPARDGFNFKGWCTTQTADGGTCTGTTYNPDGGGTNLTWTLNQTASSNSLTIYAMWESAGPTMQSATWDDLQNLIPNTGDSIRLVDERDGQKYWVGRQADGNVWMTQNLDLDIGGTNTATLTSENTDLNTSGSAPYVDGYSTSGGVITWSPASTATTSGRTINGSTVTPAMPTNTAANSAPYSAEGGDRYYYTTGTTSKETAQTLAECTAVSGRSEELCAHYHSGNYYNWTAAIASNASSGISTEYAVATNSICPKGWKLPQGRTKTSADPATRQFGNLWYTSDIITSVDGSSYATDGFNKIRTSPLFFVRGGYVYGSSLNSSGLGGYYWSSSVYSASLAYYAYFFSSGITSTYTDYRGWGQPLRCMFRKPKIMQEVDQWKNDLTTVGEQVKVVDNRDGHEYWVAKQADGNIWMTQNLDLDIGGSGVATLTSENTDLNTSGTAPYTSGYSSSGGVITWSPASTAYPSGRVINGTSVSGWTSSTSAPYSAEGGDRYYYTTGTTSDETMQTLAECTAVSGRTEEDCAHYHSGNYYNWTAAIASNASSGISTLYGVAANSICPKGWKLPQGRSKTAGDATTRQFGNLWYTSGIITSVSGSSYATNGFNKIRTSPLFFVRGGSVDSSSLDGGGNYGGYWSSSANTSPNAFNASFSSSYIPSASNNSRYYGRSVRCMVR